MVAGIIVILAVFLILGIIFSSGKASFLIAGFNTMSEEEKEKYDQIALSKFMGKMMFALSFSLMILVLSETLENRWLLIVGPVLFIVIFVFMLIYTNSWERFKK
ncbi:DUF3784 domain-containing protein [Virgibacillus siamensis]|uniref:DUF3784 domain-containing protein n=1 Tax=Virgibacillus siamensis TaxID=480071 RepID=UPI00098453FC|nr:DUF3784 domain-containing protein [Virgibacillus siamensis]